MRHFASQCSRRPAAHAESRKLTESQLERLKREFAEEQADPQVGKERRIAAARERQRAAWKPPESPSAESAYRMNLGKCKGLTVQEVQHQDAGCFSALIAWKNSFLDERRDSKTALEEAAMLEELLKQRPHLQRERTLKACRKLGRRRTKMCTLKRKASGGFSSDGRCRSNYYYLFHAGFLTRRQKLDEKRGSRCGSNSASRG